MLITAQDMGEKKVEKFEIKRLKSNISPVTLSEK